MKLEKIRFFIIWFGYLFVSIIGTVIYSIVYKTNIVKYLSLTNFKEILLFSTIGFIVQISIFTMLLTIISAIKSDINWYKVTGSIKLSNNLPKAIRLLYPLSRAFFEEIYFRGCIFLIILNEFNFINLAIAITIVSILFVVQQVLNTQNRYQAISRSVSGISISAVCCVLIVATNSFIPALLCHEFYVIFYLRS